MQINVDEPITKDEYNSAFDSAVMKYQRIVDNTKPEDRENYGFDYFMTLLKQQLIQDRFSNESIFEYKKRNTPKSAPMNTIIISEFELSVKGVFSNV